MIIREAKPSEFKELGQLMVTVYSQLNDFPKIEDQPDYYNALINIGDFTKNTETKLLVALSSENKILGAVLYFGNIIHYGSKVIMDKERSTSGIRFLAVKAKTRGFGIGKALTIACIDIAKSKKHTQVILHTTKAMQLAWKMYERIGFKRFSDIDFEQQKFPVFGFRLTLKK